MTNTLGSYRPSKPICIRISVRRKDSLPPPPDSASGTIRFTSSFVVWSSHLNRAGRPPIGLFPTGDPHRTKYINDPNFRLE